MASALVGGLLAKGGAAADLSVIERSEAQRQRLSSRYAVHVSPLPDEATRAAETLVLAVKPQDMREALAPLAPLVRGKLVVSVAAGVRIADLARWLGGHRKLVRCMPNTPALIGAGITGLYAPRDEVGPEERGRVETILGAVGEVLWLQEERLLEPVTALSGSGPAYVFWFIEQLAASGEALGLPAQVSRRLALKTVLGAAQLAAQSGQTPAQLRRQVTSSGGTTEAALRVFDEERMAERLRRALEAASRRGAELGEAFGKEQ